MPGRSFADVLDATVAGEMRQVPPPRAPPPACSRTEPLTGAAYPWWPGAARFARADAGTGTPRPRPMPLPTPRVSRTLTPPQRAALDALRQAGACELSGGCSEADLKRAFRRLARRLHPDAHPWADGSAASELAAAFGRVREAYETLLGAVVRPIP